MRRAVLILPNWLSSPGDDSVLKASMPALERFTESGNLSKVEPVVEPGVPAAKDQVASTTTEAAWLGIDPRTLALQQGPLMVSALGADPPAGSVHFHLSLMSLEHNVARRPTHRILQDQLSSILLESKKLNTRALTIVEGEDVDHGLVWEDGSIELGTLPASALDGQPIAPGLPEGDGERILRRFIDDSVNLLSEMPYNEERREEGQEPLNLLWPWGQGFRVDVPSLALRRGAICQVESSSLRLHGLTRLVGYRHGDRAGFGKLAKIDLESLYQTIRSNDRTVAVIDSFASFREAHRWEEMEWLSQELDRRLLARLWDLSRLEPLHLTILAPNLFPDATGVPGLALEFRSGMSGANPFPFDERALEERKLETVKVWSAVDRALG